MLYALIHSRGHSKIVSEWTKPEKLNRWHLYNNAKVKYASFKIKLKYIFVMYLSDQETGPAQVFWRSPRTSVEHVFSARNICVRASWEQKRRRVFGPNCNQIFASQSSATQTCHCLSRPATFRECNRRRNALRFGERLTIAARSVGEREKRKRVCRTSTQRGLAFSSVAIQGAISRQFSTQVSFSIENRAGKRRFSAPAAFEGEWDTCIH